jgi:hypothetical protein
MSKVVSTRANSALQKLILLGGFLLISIAVFVAWSNPANSYELSIYNSTPVLFWLLVLTALLIAIVLSSQHYVLFRFFGIFLGGIAMLTIYALPVIRGYYFVGETDSLRHLGRTIDLNQGTISVLDSFYPALFTLGSVIVDITHLEIPHVLMLIVVIFIMLFLVFIVLTARAIYAHHTTVMIAAFSGFLLLPITHIGSHMELRPNSQGLMFASLLLYLLTINIKRNGIRYVVLFMLAAIMSILLHPQLAANIIIFMGAILVAKFSYSYLSHQTISRDSYSLFYIATMFMMLFWLRVRELRNFEDWLGQFIASLFVWDTTSGESTRSRAASLTNLGGSVEELFLKLFLIDVFYYVAFAVLLISIVVSYTRYRDSPIIHLFVMPDINKKIILYFAIGFIAIMALFVMWVLTGISDQYVRYYAFLMVVITVLGAVSLSCIMNNLYINFSYKLSYAVCAILLAVLLVASVPVIFSSPYIYYDSSHVTEAQIEGYETTLEYRSEGVPFDYVRSIPRTYAIAIEGSEEATQTNWYSNEENDDGLPDHFADRDLRNHVDSETYVPVTEADRVRDPVLWRGFRFSHEDFEYLDEERGINKVQSNGGYDLYYIYPE